MYAAAAQVVIFGLVDMIYVNTFIAAFVTYMVDLLIRFVRHQLAVRNVARKTLIDERFLL